MSNERKPLSDLINESAAQAPTPAYADTIESRSSVADAVDAIEQKEERRAQESYWDSTVRNTQAALGVAAQNFGVKTLSTWAIQQITETGENDPSYDVMKEPLLNEPRSTYDKRAFVDIRNRADFLQRVKQINWQRDSWDRPISEGNAALNFATGMIADPTNAIPGIGIVRGVAGAVSLPKTIAAGAAAGAAVNVIADSIQTASDMTNYEHSSLSLENLALGAALGGIIGGGVGALVSRREAKALREIGMNNPRKDPDPVRDATPVQETVSPTSLRLDPDIRPLDGPFDPAQSGIVRAVRDGDEIVIVDGQRRMAAAQRDGVENINVEFLDGLTATDARQVRFDAMVRDGRMTLEDLIAEQRLNPNRHVLDNPESAYGLASRAARIDEDVLVALPGRGYKAEDILAYGNTRYDLPENLRTQYDVAMRDYDKAAPKSTQASRVAAAREIARHLNDGVEIDMQQIARRASAIDAITDRMQKPNAPILPESIRC